MKNIWAVANTKGGAGKTTIASQILPLLAKDNQSVKVYEIDNNNKTSLKNSELVNFVNLKTTQADGVITDIAMDELLNNEDELKIIDCGGGDDTVAIIEMLGKYDISGVNYVIPINEDIEQIFNLRETIALINKNDPDAKIYIALNRCNSMDIKSIKKQFIGLYGSEQYAIDPADGIEADDILFIPGTPIFGLLKSMYGTSIIDVIPKAREAAAEPREIRMKFLEEATEIAKEKGAENNKEVIKEEFGKLMAWYALAKDILELSDLIKEKNKVLFN
jgi:hypothetical protein